MLPPEAVHGPGLFNPGSHLDLQTRGPCPRPCLGEAPPHQVRPRETPFQSLHLRSHSCFWAPGRWNSSPERLWVTLKLRQASSPARHPEVHGTVSTCSPGRGAPGGRCAGLCGWRWRQRAPPQTRRHGWPVVRGDFSSVPVEAWGRRRIGGATVQTPQVPRPALGGPGPGSPAELFGATARAQGLHPSTDGAPAPGAAKVKVGVSAPQQAQTRPPSP